MTTTDDKIAEILDHLTALREGQTNMQEHLREYDTRLSKIEKKLARVRTEVGTAQELILDVYEWCCTLTPKI